MINREIIRIKIVQLAYAYYQNGNNNIDTAEKELLFSLSKTYDLYNYLLDLIVAVTREERRRIDLLTRQAQREGKTTPSQKFIFNRFATQLEENKMLNEFLEDKHITWDDDQEFVRKLCDRVEQSEIYQEYMSQPAGDYNEDRELWRRLYKQLIEDNTDIDALLEEKSLYWNDDKNVVDTFVLKTIKRFDPKNKSRQELLPEYASQEDKEFARKLFRATILNADTYQRYMSDYSRNWDFSRMAYMDIIILQIAIAELLTFPAIPVSVTINEYVDLAKLYSTPRSGGYVNGMLDHLARYFNQAGLMNKPMEERKPRQDYRRGDGDRYRDDDGQRPQRMRFVHRPRIGEQPAAGNEAAIQPSATDMQSSAVEPQKVPEAPKTPEAPTVSDSETGLPES